MILKKVSCNWQQSILFSKWKQVDWKQVDQEKNPPDPRPREQVFQKTPLHKNLLIPRIQRGEAMK